jgi:hypothetical protein
MYHSGEKALERAMKRFSMGNLTAQRRAADTLARIRESAERKQFLEKRRSLLPSEKLQELISEHGIINAHDIAWTHFGCAVEERSRKFWKLIIDGIQMIKDRRGL